MKTGELSLEAKRTRSAAAMSLGVGLVLLVFKFWGFRMTGSQAVFSDAMESIVNVVAAGVAIVVVIVAARPADKDHPYGHGKIEFFSAAFEGGLIAFAAAMICVEAVQALLSNNQVQELNFGIAVVLGAGFANLLLGLYLLRSGRKNRSLALVASAEHLLSDFWTSAGVAIGLLLVSLTGLNWLDPVMALIVGLMLAKTGIQLVRRSAGGLLDEEDRDILGNLADIIGKKRTDGIIQVHHCRVIRSGKYHHIDAHVVIPEFWDVAKAHQATDTFESVVIGAYPNDGEIHFHVDPCRQAYCRFCDVKDCPIRRKPFEKRRLVTIDELTNPNEPVELRSFN